VNHHLNHKKSISVIECREYVDIEKDFEDLSTTLNRYKEISHYLINSYSLVFRGLSSFFKPWILGEISFPLCISVKKIELPKTVY
jgi:hypothetical protein